MNAILEPLAMNRDAPLTEILLAYMRAIDAHSWPGSDGLTLDLVLDSYPHAAFVGHVPGKDELLRRHPELANELEALFARRKAAPRRPSDPFISPLYFEHTD